MRCSKGLNQPTEGAKYLPQNGTEVSVVANGVEKGVSRELVDSLRAELEDHTQSIQKLESDLLTLRQKLDQEEQDHRKTKESGVLELSRAQQTLQSAEFSHKQKLLQLEEQHKQSKNELLKQHGEQLRAIDNQLVHVCFRKRGKLRHGEGLGVRDEGLGKSFIQAQGSHPLGSSNDKSRTYGI